MTELRNYEITYNNSELNDKLLDSLPSKWEIYALLIKENSSYGTAELDTIVGKLRAYNLAVQRKDAGNNQVQDPGIYHGKPVSSSSAGNGGATAFFSGENSENLVLDADGEVCLVSKSSSSRSNQSKTNNEKSNSGKSMPMSVQSAEQQIVVLSSFIASYENYIQGKINDPTIFDEDYDQIDPDDLEEMDLQWNLAMILRRAKRFMDRIGRKLVGGKAGFDKSKVKCYNC
mgnify:CR=1 FL=1